MGQTVYGGMVKTVGFPTIVHGKKGSSWSCKSTRSIWEFIKKAIKKPTSPKDLEVYEYLEMKVRLVILYGVKDPLIPHFFGKNIAHEMWMDPQNLFKNKNKNQILVLEDNLKSTKLITGERVTSY